MQIQFPVSSNMDHGLCLESGVYISHIAPGSQAAKDGSLAVGDRILTVSNQTIGFVPKYSNGNISRILMH